MNAYTVNTLIKHSSNYSNVAGIMGGMKNIISKDFGNFQKAF